jgi:hypothetical protein
VIFGTLRVFLKVIALMSWVVLSSTWGHAQPTIIVSESFDAPTFPARWGIGAQLGAAVSISTDRGSNYQGSAGSLRGIYPPNAKGGSYIWTNYSLSALNLSDIYIEFRAKMPSNPVRGLKCVVTQILRSLKSLIPVCLGKFRLEMALGQQMIQLE